MRPYILAIVWLLLGAACTRAAEPQIQSQWSPAQIEDLIQTARASDQEGLPLELTLIDKVERSAAETSDERDKLATALFDQVAHDFALGRTDPQQVEPSWRLSRGAIDVPGLRAAALLSGRVGPALRSLLPQGPEYAALRSELARLRMRSDDDAASQMIAARANLERHRWAPRELPLNRLEVRIPFYALSRFVGGVAVADYKVIVGKPRTPTPSFSAEIEAVTVNPYWTPPNSIVFGELIPAFRRDPDRVKRQEYEILDGSGAIMDPHAIDWTARPFPYVIRQRPGEQNALGRLKFEMPNPYAVFVHDTPSRRLFDRDNRALSHGCIRAQNPLDLAVGVGAGDAGALRRLIDAGETVRLPLSAALPIYVLYLTTSADDEGVITYAPDIYKRDAALVRALDAPRAIEQTSAPASASLTASNAANEQRCALN